MFQTFILILAVLLGRPTLAENTCEGAKSVRTVDLRSKFGAIRDQDSVGSCYAEGAADQLNYKMMQKPNATVGINKKDRVSSAALVVDYNGGSRKEMLNRVDLAVAQRNVANIRGEQLNEELKKSKNAVMALAQAHANPSTNLKKSLDSTRTCRGESGCEYSREDLFNVCASEVPNCKGAVSDYDRIHKEWSENSRSIEYRAYKEKDGGSPFRTLEEGIKNGICRDEDVPSEDAAIGSTFNPAMKASDEIASYLMNPGPDQLCRAEDSIRVAFPRFVGNIKEVLDNYRSVDPMTVFMKSCRRIPVDASADVKIIFQRGNVFYDQVDRALDRLPPAPVGIIYDQNIFKKPVDEIPPIKDGETYHYSLIVGKQFNCTTNETEYLVRNSWGSKSCETDRALYRSKSADEDALNQLETDNMACMSTCLPEPSPTPEDAPEVDNFTDEGPPVEAKRVGNSKQKPKPKSKPKRTEPRARQPSSFAETRVCRQRCTDTYRSKSILIHKPSYHCTSDGYYVVGRSTLQKMSSGGYYLE